MKMAIIHRCHLDVQLDQTQVNMIQAKLLIAGDANPQGETPPQFLYSKFALGVFWITCANESSKAWLMRTVSGHGELWEGAELTMVDSKETQGDFSHSWHFRIYTSHDTSQDSES